VTRYGVQCELNSSVINKDLFAEVWQVIGGVTSVTFLTPDMASKNDLPDIASCNPSIESSMSCRTSLFNTMPSVTKLPKGIKYDSFLIIDIAMDYSIDYSVCGVCNNYGIDYPMP